MKRNPIKHVSLGSALLLALATSPAVLNAQSNTVIVGTPANFDVVNDTGQTAYGFEIEADGIHSTDLTRIFGGTTQPCYIRYCQGTATDFVGGVYIRWKSPYDPNTGQFTQGTPIPLGSMVSGESCWTFGMGANYPNAGCEHFGISTLRSPTQTTYYWLVADPNNPGQLVRYSGPPVAAPPGSPVPPPVPAPVYHPIIVINPPAQPAQPPVVVFHIQVPPPPPPPPALPPQFGDAKWVKVFEGEVDHEVDVNDLVAGNAIVPMDDTKVETPWKLLQFSPRDPAKGQLNNQHALGNGSHAVVRRYEFYKYTGHYDPSTHEALCGDGVCNAPGPGELGDMVAAQMAAANVEITSVTVAKIGSGTVSSSNGKINCGGSCTTNVVAGTQLTLNAQAPGNGLFSGWSGDCSGADPSCTVTVNRAMNMTAAFTTVYTLSIGRGNGVVTGTPDGAFGTSINCGSSCSAKYPQGTTVTLSATPNAGHTFINWTGACSGTTTTCAVTITKDTSVQANFK
jgi:hypothetical protein